MKASLSSFLILLGIVMACNSKKAPESDNRSTDTVVTEPYKAVVTLPEPNEKEAHVLYSKVIGWPADKKPQVQEGFQIERFVTGIKSPRNIYIAPNGDIFVAFANTESKGIKKKITDEVTGRNESQHTQKSLNQIYIFRDEDGDGKPETQQVYLSNLNQPFGMLVLGEYFYVANTDGLWRYPYKAGELTNASNGEKILKLPAGGYNNHWTRNIISNNDGSKIYVAVGSASDHAEHGIKEEEFRANILEVNPDGTGRRIVASGLRNPVGMAIHPTSNELWTVVNERDNLGDDLVPDYLTQVQDGGFYGWPYSYYGQHVDPRIKADEQKPELVSKAIVPDLALDAHSATLGLAFYNGNSLPAKYRDGAFIAQHGSWNRSQFTGYRIGFVPFKAGKIVGPAEDFITGFIADAEKGEVYGRPVAVAITKEGDLLITDDASDTIWFVKYKG